MVLFAAAAAAVAAAAGITGTAAASVGTADAFFTAFLCLDDVANGSAEDDHQYGNNNDIFHTYFFPLRAYSAFSFLSELTHR